MVRGEADQHGIAAVALAYEPADVQLAALAHLRGSGVAEMRIVRPDDDLGTPALPTEVRHQFLECLGHVAIAQVPR
jgi:hypothetical protein